ncbi:MAG: ABC transporter ATP-binding protein [Gammaproteobacteria bacterium]|nr:ABC transporter ATP-binding protein [Gammaproteobacteria bacterium]
MTADNASHYLRFDGVKKSYDQKSLVVKDFNLDIAKGEFLTLLGPSGSGKTTVLMMMAGFESVTSGDILLDGHPVTRTAPYKRNIGMVFQNYALFPHMSIAENLAYPLKVRKMAKAEITERVYKYLKLIELDQFGGRTPAQLSGGQRQRVALARALIFKPSLVLMDEPLGALDKKLREQMQLEITRLHKKLGFTVIYVTHDQSEALTMSDRIAVFEDGVVQQCASPEELYEQPANSFVADFIGENNLLPGTVIETVKGIAKVKMLTGDEITARCADCGEGNSECVVSVRPEKVFIVPGDHHYENKITVKFTNCLYVGDFIRYFFELPDGTEVVAKFLNDHVAPKLSEGDKASLYIRTKDCFAFKVK